MGGTETELDTVVICLLLPDDLVRVVATRNVPELLKSYRRRNRACFPVAAVKCGPEQFLALTGLDVRSPVTVPLVMGAGLFGSATLDGMLSREDTMAFTRHWQSLEPEDARAYLRRWRRVTELNR